MSSIQQYLQYSLYFFLTLAFADAVMAWFKAGHARRNPREAVANFGVYAVGKVWRDYVTKGIELTVLVAASRLAPHHLPETAWMLAMTVLAADFVYYWKHRAEHSVRVLWAYHSVHHSSEEFNFTTAFRLPWFGNIFGVVFYVPLVLAGFNPLWVMLARQLVLLYQFWIHTEAVGRLGAFDLVLNSPSNHRVHHGSNPVYLDKNHGGILIIWDRLFGTYQRELAAQPVVYGLTHPLGTRNPFLINVKEPLATLRKARRASSFREACGHLFRGPGWTPAATQPASAHSGLVGEMVS